MGNTQWVVVLFLCWYFFFFPECNVQGLAFPHHVARVQQKVQNGVKTVL